MHCGTYWSDGNECRRFDIATVTEDELERSEQRQTAKLVAESDLACPSWCDPTQHIAERQTDGTVVAVHRSRPTEVVGLCDPRVTMAVKAGVPESVHIDIDPGGWAELESATEAGQMVAEFNRVMNGLIAAAWPDA